MSQEPLQTPPTILPPGGPAVLARSLNAGDRLAFMSAGAYGAVLSSSYNARPLVPEVLVDGDRYEIVRRRPSFEESVELEKVPEWLTTAA